MNVMHRKTESSNLKKLASELNSSYIFCDITNEEKVRESVNKLGKIEILVNSAGINISKPFLKLTKKDWLDIFKTNVLGTVNFSKAVIPQMLERKYGKIINLASVKGYSSVSGRPAYASSKAAIINLTANLASEFAPYILVNAVAPGFTDTEMTESTISVRVKKQIDSIPLKRVVKPEEIAEVILFLASDKCNYMTGQTMLVDGGYSIK